MQFDVETKALQQALSVVGVGVAGQMTLPILGNVKIKAAEDQLHLSCSNLDIFVRRSLPAKVSKTGAITIPFRLFSRLVARITATRITLEEKKNSVEFKSGEVEAVFETLPAEEFPPAPEQPNAQPLECEAEELINALSMVEHAISHDASRYILLGIFFSPGNNGVAEFVATDGRRMSVALGPKLGTEGAIMPEIFIRAVLSIQPSGKISILLSNGFITVVSDNVQISGRLIEGTYPNWAAIMPESCERFLSCGRLPLIEALKTCAIFEAGKDPVVTLIGKGKEIEVTHGNKARVMVLGTELKGQPDLSMKMNARYLIEMLSVAKGADVRLQKKDDGSPLLLEEKGFRAIVQGIRSA